MGSDIRAMQEQDNGTVIRAKKANLPDISLLALLPFQKLYGRACTE
jgi:hypothetical protein